MGIGILGIDIMGVDILGVDILEVDIPAHNKGFIAYLGNVVKSIYTNMFVNWVGDILLHIADTISFQCW